jgi:hypothetical protein
MKRLVYILVFVFCVWSFNSGIYAQSNFTVSVSKMSYMYKHPIIPEGLITIGFTPGAQRTFLSIGATNTTTQQFDIIVANMLLPSSSDVVSGSAPLMMSTTFDFSKISQPPYLANIILTIYVHILTSFGFYPFDPSTFKDQKTVAVNQFVNDAKGPEAIPLMNVPIKSVVRPGQTLNDPLKDYYFRSDAPNLDLDNSQHGISTTYAGDLNACVPTATANSMKWAQSKYVDINLPADMDLRKTEMELSGFMKRDSGRGTSTENMLSGKLDFIEKYKLPMEVKYQAYYVNNPVGVASPSGKSIARSFNPRPPKPPTWDFLKKMMKNGEDVEMNFTWYDTTDRKWYAHSVNMVGMQEYQSGYKWMAFRHDARQSAAGGTTDEGYQITVDGDGWMRFGQNNENFIRDVVVESPVIQEGKETAAWLNELFTDAPLRKISSSSVVPRFVEVALKNTITDLSNYTITLYDGKTGASYATYTLDQFTAGTTTNGLKVYSMNIPGLLGPPAGVAISHTGAVIQNQFMSYGGSFVAADGDATGLTSNNLGDIPTNSSVQINGSGTAFSQFGISYGVPTPGDINQDESYVTSNLSKPGSIAPNNGDRNKTGPVAMTWSKVPGASNYEVQVSSDPFFLTNVIVTNTTITDTTYSFANANLEGSRLYWRIRASASTMKSGYSATRNFSDALSSPTNLDGFSSASRVNLTWKNTSTRLKATYIQRKTGDINSANPFQTIDSVNSTAYADSKVQSGSTYTYRVYAYNDVAESDYSNTKSIIVVTTGVHDDNLPTDFRLDQNYPNPFNPSTRISFAVPKTGHVTLTIADALGRMQAVLVDGERPAGTYTVEWNAANAPSGIYFYRLQAGGFVETKKMILIR